MLSLGENNTNETWILVLKAKGAKTIACKWLLKKKNRAYHKLKLQGTNQG